MKKLYYELWSYDVWGNAEDGYEVNDRACEDRKVPFRCKDGECPTLRQIAKRIGCKPSDITLDGDDTSIYVNASDDGKPLFEFIKCVDD